MRHLFGALAALSLCALPYGEARAENKVEVYYQGSVIPFGRAEKRFVCDAIEPIQQFLTAVRAYGEKKAYTLIREPVKSLSGNAVVLQDDIMRLLPAADLITTFCHPAPKQLFVLAAMAVEWFGDHEVTSVLVMDVDTKMSIAYFLDIRVLQPMADTQEAKRLMAVQGMLRERLETQNKSTPGVWKPLGEAR